jgi:hypothetical protein
MKKDNSIVLGLLILGGIIYSLLTSCGRQDSSYDLQYSNDGSDSVVYVHYYDPQGNYQQFWMDYVMFQTLYNSGGYDRVYHYYYTTPYYRTPAYSYRYHRYSTDYVPRTSRYYNRYHSGYSSSNTSPARRYSPSGGSNYVPRSRYNTSTTPKSKYNSGNSYTPKSRYNSTPTSKYNSSPTSKYNSSSSSRSGSSPSRRR